MPLPFNSEVHGFLTRAKVYCAKVLPLVFDNSLSYYESLLKFMHKLNECIDAINAQNLNIVEFEHMVTLEIEKFESYVETRQAEFENTLKAEWEAEKVLNQQFRADMEQAWHEYQNRISLQWQTFVQQFTDQWNTWKDEIQQDLTTFKNNIEEQQDDFEAHILQLQTAFEAREQQARVAYQNNLTTNMENWKNATASAFQASIHDWEVDTRSELETEFQLYINQQIGGAIATLQTTISQLDHSLSLERTARQEADQALSNRIDRLTPEGMIQSDAPDADNNSQLYVVDPTTQQRTNIYPVINPQGGEDDRKYFVPSQDEMQLSVNWGTLALTNDRGFVIRNLTTIGQGATVEGSMFAIRKNLIENATQDALHDFAMLDIQILSLSGENTIVKIKNVTGGGTSSIRYTNINGVSHLVIPVEITNNNNYDLSQYALQVYCSISQYLGGTTVGAGSDITVDSELSTTSTNPVQNRIITNALNERPTQTAVNGQLAQKADTSTVTALEAVVNQKANQSTVQTLETSKVSWTDVHNTVQQGDGSPVNGNAVWAALQGFTPTIPDASAVTKGIMQMGSGLLDGGNGVANVQTATTHRKGIIQVGNNLSIDANSILSVPDATDNVAGAVHLTDTLGNTTSAITSRAVNAGLELKAGKNLEQYAVRSDAPDSQGVSQFYKLDAQGNRTNVYPALSPVGSLNWVVPKIPSEASINDDVFITNYYNTSPTIAPNYNVYDNIIYKNSDSTYYYYLWINALKYGIVTINDAFNLFTAIPVASGESSVNVGFLGVDYGISTNPSGYAVIGLSLPKNGIKYGVKLLYG